jgi:hypothetical protein
MRHTFRVDTDTQAHDIIDDLNRLFESAQLPAVIMDITPQDADYCEYELKAWGSGT